MKRENLVLKWKKKGKEYVKEIDRERFYDVMKSIRDAFGYNNPNSTVLCMHIPEMDILYIDKDRNDDLDIPFVQYYVDEEQYILNIMRNHRIIWSILDGYTQI